MNLPTASGSEHFLRIPFTKIVGRRRLFSSPNDEIADRLRLCAIFALHSQKLGDVSGSVHPHGENCRQPQALGTPFHEICGTSQAACTPIMLLPRGSGPVRPRSREARGVSGGLHAPDEIADSLRLCTLVVHSTHENGGASQAACTAMLKIADSLRLCALALAKIVGMS